MQLEAEEIEEGTKEFGGGKSESSFEVGKKHHSLTGLRSGDLFLAG